MFKLTDGLRLSASSVMGSWRRRAWHTPVSESSRFPTALLPYFPPSAGTRPLRQRPLFFSDDTHVEVCENSLVFSLERTLPHAWRLEGHPGAASEGPDTHSAR